MAKQFKLFIPGLILAISFLFSGCATNPVTGKQDFALISEEKEIKIGQREHQNILKQFKKLENPGLQNYVEGLVQELASKSHRSNLDFHVTVLDSPDINAFALPGGYIYITRGIMAYMNSEAELAGVLGHEIGHVTARHGVRQQSAGQAAGAAVTILGAATAWITRDGRIANEVANQAGRGSLALIRGYGRKHELEADRLGAEYLANVGYDPEEMINVVEILKDQEDFDKQLAKEEGREPRAYHGTFSTHPSNDLRLQEVVRAANKITTASTRDANREEFLKYMDGIVLGHNEADGILHANKFYHKDLDLFIEFPENWSIRNLPDRLIAQNKSGDAQLQITLQQLKSGQSPKQYLEELTKGNIKNGEAFKTTSFNGYTGLTTVKIQGGSVPARVAAIASDQKVYQVTIIAKDSNALKRNDGATYAMLRSFRNLKRSDLKFASAKRLKLVRVKKGDTFSSLAKKSNLSHHPVEQLQLLNGMYPDGVLKEGQLVKIVQ